MEYLDTLENIHGEKIRLYQTNDGKIIVLFEEHTTRKFSDIETATKVLYKAGFRF